MIDLSPQNFKASHIHANLHRIAASLPFHSAVAGKRRLVWRKTAGTSPLPPLARLDRFTFILPRSSSSKLKLLVGIAQALRGFLAWPRFSLILQSRLSLALFAHRFCRRLSCSPSIKGHCPSPTRTTLCCLEAECHFCYLRDSSLYVHESCCLGDRRHPLTYVGLRRFWYGPLTKYGS